MTTRFTRSLVVASLVLGTFAASTAFAQAPAAGTSGTAVTRAQVKMDRDAFLAMVRWDASTEQWVLKDGMQMPTGVPSRNEVKAMRDKFLSMNNWSETTGQYVPVTGAPRDMSKLTREQVKAETTRFLSMYRFSEENSDWVLRGR